MKLSLFNLKINNISFDGLLEQIVANAIINKSSFLCAVNVHMTVEAQSDEILKKSINSATWAVTDGMPIVWSFRIFNKKGQDRVAGMDIIPSLLEKANDNELVISVYGNTQDNLDGFKDYILSKYPRIKIGALISPPFRKIVEKEKQRYIDDINKNKSQIVFVSLGCPKQEKWMLENSKNINGVCLGIGNAINTTIGNEKRPPKFIQNVGLEWFFRLIQNPKRLVSRYLKTNTKFIFLFFKKLIVNNAK